MSDSDADIFRLGRLSVQETGVGTKTGSIAFDVFSKDGEEIRALDVTPDGIVVAGNLKVIGQSSEIATDYVNVQDKHIYLAHSATEASHIDGGGFSLGTESSGVVRFQYGSVDNAWNINANVRLDAGMALGIGEVVRLSDVGLGVGSVRLSAEGLVLSDSVGLGSDAGTGLHVGGVSVSSSGVSIGSTARFDGDGLSVGIAPSIVTVTSTGLALGTDASLTSEGLRLANGGTSLSDSAGLRVSDDVTLTAGGGLRIGQHEGCVILDRDSLEMGTALSLSPGGLMFGNGEAEYSPSGIRIGTDGTATSLRQGILSIGEGVVLCETGLALASSSACITMGPSRQWRIKFDASTQNLLFEALDVTSGMYVTKMELRR
jgi:hypothetical protein